MSYAFRFTRVRAVAYVLPVVAALLLSACAGGPPFQPPPVADAKADIVVFRTSSIVGGANVDIVAVNDVFIARLSSGTYAIHTVEPGTIHVSRRAGSILGSGSNVGYGLGGLVGLLDGFHEVAAFEAEAGRRYYVRFSHGKRVEEKEALKLMDGLERLDPPEH